MRYTILFAVAFALATNTARAMNSFYYECGDDTEVALAIAKDTGKVLGTNVWIKIRLRVASTNKSLAQSNKENCSGCDGYHSNLPAIAYRCAEVAAPDQPKALFNHALHQNNQPTPLPPP